MVTARLTAVWHVMTSKGVYLLTQRKFGEEPGVEGFGAGDIKDMVLMSRAMKQSYDHFIDMINQVATETGDLHTLQEIRDALDAMQGVHHVGNE